MLIYVLAKDGSPLMPTYNIRKVRHMLKDGRAVIAGHKPGFTIRLTYDLPEQKAPHTQGVELCEDTGDHHIGVSVKSEKHEFVHAEYRPLPDEKQRHDDCRKYRRTRRNNKRYRKPRFDNRRKRDGWFPPSVENKTRLHADIIAMYSKVLPVTSATLETARFDTQLLEAQQSGGILPEGKDYQQGSRYLINNLREAVFTRDGYTCRICGKTVRDGAILRIHHALYWKGDHTDRMSGLMTVCTSCHTPSNHKKGGKLWGITPTVKSMAGAAFMNAIRYHIVELCCKRFPLIEIHTTNGAATKYERNRRHMTKTHANDAYVMGLYHPRHKAHETVYQKRRRNNRILSKFYDAKYIDIRDGETKSGSQLGCNRTNRSESRRSDKNERIFRGRKVSSGHVNIRKAHYPYQPEDTVLLDGHKEKVSGMQNYGTRVILKRKSPSGKQISIAVCKISPFLYSGGWVAV